MDENEVLALSGGSPDRGSGREEAQAANDVIIIDDSSEPPAAAQTRCSAEGSGEAAMRPIPGLQSGAAASPSPSQDSEGVSTCLICYDQWSTCGPHRVVCLKCGHLYGESCILQWLRQNPKCPQCNARAQPQDLRPIYTPNVVAVDNTELIQAQREAQNERLLRKQADGQVKHLRQCMTAELSLLKADLKAAKAEMERLQDFVTRQRTDEESGTCLGKRRAPDHSSGASARDTPLRSLFNTASPFKVAAAHARSFDLNARDGLVLLAHKQPPTVYGLEKVSMVAGQRCRIPLHPLTGVVRDIQLSQDGRQAAVASLGGEPLQVVNVANGTVVTRLPLRIPAWSCAWDTGSEHRILCGLQDGAVAVFDLRRTDSALAVHNSPDLRHPVHTVKSCECMGSCKVLSASIGGVHAWVASDGDSGHAAVEAAGPGPPWDPSSIHALRIVDGVGHGGQPCMSLACGSGRFTTAVASFRASGGNSPFHWVGRRVHLAAGDSGLSIGAVNPWMVEREVGFQGGSPSSRGHLSGADQAISHEGVPPAATDVSLSGPALSAQRPPVVAGWGLWGRLGGHRYSSSATMSQTAIACPRDSVEMPWLACADELTKQMWLWDLGSGDILGRFPAHESHITCIRSSPLTEANPGLEALACLSDQSLQVFLPHEM